MPDPANNSKLRDVIAKAKSNNMPNDTIERGIKKAAGDANSVNYVQNTYEGYGLNGIAIIVETLTDNKNRTAAERTFRILQRTWKYRYIRLCIFHVPEKRTDYCI